MNKTHLSLVSSVECRVTRWTLALLIFLVTCHPSLVTSQTVPTYFTNLLYTGVTNDTSLLIKAPNAVTVFNGVYYTWPPTGSNILTTNGVASINLIPGPYTVSFAGIPSSWTLNVPNTPGTPINASQHSTNLVKYSGIQSISGAGGITVFAQSGPSVIVSNAPGSGGGGFNSVVNTNATNFSFSGNTLFGPTAFDPAGAAAATNSAIISQLISATNGALLISSNNATVVSNGVVAALVSSTNGALLISSNNATVVSNGVIGALVSSTNGALLISSNNATVVSNNVIAALVSGTNGDLLISSNNATVVSNGVIAALVSGTNGDLRISSNNATVVSNGVVAALVSGTNGALLISSNNATVVSNGVVAALVSSTNGALLISSNNATVVSNGVVAALVSSTNVALLISSNNATVVSNGVVAALVSSTNGALLISSNNATVVSNGVVAALVSGTNGALLISSNNATVVSNSVVAALVSGTNGALLISSNNATVVSNGVVAALVSSTNGALLISSNNATVVSNGVVAALVSSTNGALLISSNNATFVSNGVVAALVSGTNGALLISSNNATVVSNGVISALVSGTNGALLISSNNATVVSNGVIAALNTSAASKVSILNGVSSQTINTNVIVTDTNAAGLKWTNTVAADGTYQIVGAGAVVGVKLTNNHVLGDIALSTNDNGSLAIFQSDWLTLSNMSRAGSNFAQATYAPSNAPIIWGPQVLFASATQDGLVLSNASTGFLLTPSTGSPANELNFFLLGQSMPFLIGGTNSIYSPSIQTGTNTALDLETAPQTISTQTNTIGLLNIYQDTNVVTVVQCSFGTWPLGNYYWSNSWNLLTNPASTVGAVLTNTGAGQFNLKTNGNAASVESVTGSITNNAWSGAGSMTTIYGLTSPGFPRYLPGVPASDITGVLNNNTTGNAATATFATNAAVATNANTATNLYAGAGLTNINYYSNSVYPSGRFILERGSTNYFFTSFTNSYNFGWLPFDVLHLPATNDGVQGAASGLLICPSNFTMIGAGRYKSIMQCDTNFVQFTNGDVFKDFSVFSTNLWTPFANGTNAAFNAEGNAIGVVFENVGISHWGYCISSGSGLTNQITFNNCGMFAGQRCEWITPGPGTGGWTSNRYSQFTVQENTNQALAGLAALSLNGTAGSFMTNYVDGCSVTIDGNGSTNNIELIGISALNGYLHVGTTTVRAINTNNLPLTTFGSGLASVQPISLEACIGADFDSSIGSDLIAWPSVTLKGFATWRPGDDGKLGMGELLISNGPGISVNTNWFVDVPVGNSFTFDSVTNQFTTAAFTNHFAGLVPSQGEAFDFHTLAQGLTNGVNFSNASGASVTFYASPGDQLWMTNNPNLNAPVLMCSNPNVAMIVSNAGSIPLNFMIGSWQAVTNFSNPGYIPNTSMLETNECFNGTNLLQGFIDGAWFNYVTNINRILVLKAGAGSKMTAITNFWCANAVPGFRQKLVTISATGSTTNFSFPSANGYTNTTGTNEFINIFGTAGSNVFYMRGGANGQTPASVAVFTNINTANGGGISLPNNCGVQIVNGANVRLELYDSP